MLICDYWAQYPHAGFWRFRIRGATLIECDNLALAEACKPSYTAFGAHIRLLRDTIRAEVKPEGFIWLPKEKIAKVILAERCTNEGLPPWLG